MLTLFLILIVGIVSAPYVFFGMDIHHAQGFWVQSWIFIIFASSFFIKPIRNDFKNIPLGLLHLWVGLLTIYPCFIAQLNGKYNTAQFFQYFNFLCLIIMYKMATQFLKNNDFYVVFRWCRYAVLVVMGVCVLQALGLGVGMQLIFDASTRNQLNNIVVGMIGNGTHLSGLLAMCAPLFLYQLDREKFLSLVLMFILLFFTGTSMNNPSMSGFVIFFTLTGAYLTKWSVKAGFAYFLTIVIGIICFVFLAPTEVVRNFLSFNGRLEWWSYYWGVFKTQLTPIGVGLGKIGMLTQHTPFPSLRHLHLEYFHFMFEMGIVGLVLILGVFHSILRVKDYSSFEFSLKMIVVAFGISCLFNWAAHLWWVTTWAMFFYAGYCVLKNDAWASEKN